MDRTDKQIARGVRTLSKEIRIVHIGKYVGAVRVGKCPMYSVTNKENFDDWKKSLKETFPDHVLIDGTKPDRAAVAKFILMTNSR